MNIIVTGGAGYIGSHTCVALLEAGHSVIIADSLYNSKAVVIERIKKITNKEVVFYRMDVTDETAVEAVFTKHHIDGIIHFAGFKSIGESESQPLAYYKNNIVSTIVLARACLKYGVGDFVFSSSAAVYGAGETPFAEAAPLLPTSNPYGETKAISERILADAAKANPDFKVSILRYFNPVGAHESGLIGEDPKGTPNNLVPYITQVAAGKRDKLLIYGNDYKTHDGTGIRDYIHIEDVAKGHIKALERLAATKGVHTYNLGTGTGYSVFDVINSFEKVTGRTIKYATVGRRPGDIDASYADVSKAYAELGWKAEKSLDDMCRDAWKWQMNNPNGYEDLIEI